MVFDLLARRIALLRQGGRMNDFSPVEIAISQESPDSPEASALVEELDAYLIPMYPMESNHGLAKAILRHLELHTFQRGVSVLRLETGIHQLEAIALYRRFGFKEIPPFAEYLPDPLSLFFEKALTPESEARND